MSSRAAFVLPSLSARDKDRLSHRPTLLICPRKNVGECGEDLVDAFPERALLRVRGGKFGSEGLPAFLLGAWEEDWPREARVAQGGETDDGAAV